MLFSAEIITHDFLLCSFSILDWMAPQKRWMWIVIGAVIVVGVAVVTGVILLTAGTWEVIHNTTSNLTKTK